MHILGSERIHRPHFVTGFLHKYVKYAGEKKLKIQFGVTIIRNPQCNGISS